MKEWLKNRAKATKQRTREALEKAKRLLRRGQTDETTEPADISEEEFLRQQEEAKRQRIKEKLADPDDPLEMPTMGEVLDNVDEVRRRRRHSEFEKYLEEKENKRIEQREEAREKHSKKKQPKRKNTR